jgi:hypothetical protein
MKRLISAITLLAAISAHAQDTTSEESLNRDKEAATTASEALQKRISGLYDSSGNIPSESHRTCILSGLMARRAIESRIGDGMMALVNIQLSNKAEPETGRSRYAASKIFQGALTDAKLADVELDQCLIDQNIN